MPHEKLNKIRGYLLEHFPSDKHDDEIDFDRNRHKFRIITKDHILLLSVSNEFIEDNDIETMIKTFNALRIIELLKNNPQSTIVVWQNDIKGGIKVEPRN